MPIHVDSQTWRSPNHGDAHRRPVTITPAGIMLHSCEGALPEPRRTSLPWLCKDNGPVSCNYYVTRHGVVYCLVEDTRRSWHAGSGAWPGVADGNLFLGVELEHRKGQGAYPAVQLDALAQLCRLKIAEYDFPKDRIIAHRWWAPRRKQDPTDWTDGSLRHWIGTLYTSPPLPAPAPAEAERTYRLLQYAWVRSAPSTTQSARVGSLERGTVVRGAIVTGARFKGSNTWLKLAGDRFVWINPLVAEEVR